MASNIYGSSQTNPYPQSEFLDNASKRPTRAWQQFFLNLVNFTSSNSASPGSFNLPAKPAGFMNVTVNGKAYKVPYYNE